ncbi:beta strand repeat-containing protein, partial [Fulvivirgaceae bacterium LMO-SS25]
MIKTSTKNQNLFFFIFLLLFTLGFNINIQAQTATVPVNGDGSPGDPYQIATLENLYWIAATDAVVASPDRTTRQGYHYIQTANIDASATTSWFAGEGWLPISSFTGSYNGDGYVVSDLYINRPLEPFMGLFSYLNGGKVEGLGVVDVNISGQDVLGGLVAVVDLGSTVTECFATGSVTGRNNIGGLVGVINQAIISNSYSRVSLSASGMFAGGLIGAFISSTVTNSYSTGNIGGAATSKGGLIGQIQTAGTITNSFWDTDTSNQATSAGGTGKTTVQMKTQSTFTDAGWDFTSIWSICSGVNDDYPNVSFTGGIASEAPVVGDGTVGAPFQIATLANLKWITESAGRWNAHYIQTADIDASSTANWNCGEGWSPIGDNTFNFIGSYNGDGHTINGLTINRPSDGFIGLFGYINGGTVSNLGMTQVNINASDGIGAIVGFCEGCSINDTYSTGTIESSFGSTGGIVGSMITSSSLLNSFSHVSINNSSGNNVGGLAGSVNSSSTVTGSFSTGTISSNAGQIGGIVGSLSSSQIQNCYSLSSVSGNNYVGGGAGSVSSGTIINSYSTGLVSSPGANIGGFVGLLFGTNTFTNNFWDTETSGNLTSDGATGKTTAEMKTQMTFTGWDFTASTGDWNINPAGYISYPYLQGFAYDLPEITPAVNPIPGLVSIAAIGSIIITSDPSDPASDWMISDGKLIPLKDGAKVNVSEVTSALATGDLIIEAVTDVIIDANIAPALPAARNLTLKAGRDVMLEVIRAIEPSAQALNTIFWSDADGNDEGMIWIKESTTINTNGGHLWMGGGSGTVTWNSLAVGDGNATGSFAFIPGDNSSTTQNGFHGITLDLQVTIQTGAGHIELNGQSGNQYAPTLASSPYSTNVGVYLGDGSQTSTISGNITINGTARLTSDQPSSGCTACGFRYGILFHRASQSSPRQIMVSTQSGNIVLNGLAQDYTGSTTDLMNSGGVTMFAGTQGQVVSTNSGNIQIIGNNQETTAPTGRTARGVWLTSGQTDLISTSGSIVIEAGLGITSTEALALQSDTKIGDGTSGDIEIISNGWTGLTATTLISGTGELTIRPQTASTTLGIAGGTGTLELPASYFSANFVDGFSSIIIGSEDVGQVNIGTSVVNYNDPLVIKTGNSIYFDAASAITGNNNEITLWARAGGNNSASDNVPGAIWLPEGSTLDTEGGNITLGGGSDPSIGYAAGDNIGPAGENNARFRGITINGTLAAGGGNISILGKGGNVGISHARGVSIGGDISTTGTGSITITGIAHASSDGFALGDGSITGPDGTISAEEGAVTINGFRATGDAINISTAASAITSEGTITLEAKNDGRLTIDGEISGLGGVSSGNIILITDDLNLTGSSQLSSQGTLTIQTRTPTTTIGLNAASGTLSLSSDNLSTNILDGFEEIIIGGASQQGNIYANTFIIRDNFRFNSTGNLILEGNLDLNGQTVTLGEDITLDESAGRFFGSTGELTTTRTLGSLTAENIGGMGATITTSTNLGSTTITRTHGSQTKGTANSILRSYNIVPTTNTSLDATLVFNYVDGELNSLNESSLSLHRSTDGGTNWTNEGGTVNESGNTASLTGIDAFSLWALFTGEFIWSADMSTEDGATDGNWEGGLAPPTGSDIVIPEGATPYPVFDFDFEAGDITIGNNATFTMAPGFTLTFAAGKGATGDGKIILKSDGTGDASIGDLTGAGSIDVNVIQERFLAGGNRAFRFFSHPYTTAVPLSVVATAIDITGVGGSANGFTTT